MPNQNPNLNPATASIDEWDLTATNLRRIRGRKYQVAVLPTAAIEAHNLHLPEGQDYRHSNWVARTACAAAWPQCESVICLPPLPYGVDCNLMAFPLTVHVSQAALDLMVREIIQSVRKHGLRKFVIVNGHGGNDFRPLVRQVQTDLDVHVFVCDWWKIGQDVYNDYFDNPDDHAGEMETSIALALYPHLVEPSFAGSGKQPPFAFDALRRGWVSTSRDFGKLNDHCAHGDASQASADKGRRYLELCCKRLSDFLVDLAKAKIDDRFPHQ